jgi:integrase
VRVLLQTGLRKPEFLGLRWKEVDLKAGVLTIPRSKHGGETRRTFASRLAMERVDLLAIKVLGGWKTLSTVQRYAHLSPGH